MSHSIVQFPDYKESTFLNKVEAYLTDKVDQSILNNIIREIEYYREINVFNDDIYFDAIKVLTDNKKIREGTIGYVNRVYGIIEKDNNDYSFFLKMLPYVCEKDTYYMFRNLYNIFENKYYLLSLFKKREEIKSYQRLHSNLPAFDMDEYFLGSTLKKYREYYIDDKTYLLSIMEVLNQYLNDNTYSGEYALTLDYMKQEYNNLDLQEIEDNMNLISSKIDDTKEVINNTTNAINNNIDKLDSEIDNFNNRLIEIIKNNVDNIDYQSIIKDSGFNREIEEQRKRIDNLTITKLENQKIEKIKEIFNKIKEYITINNLCEENEEIEKVILNELNNMDYSKLKEQETIDYCILKYFANANDNLEYAPSYNVHENFNTWLKALDKEVSSKFGRSTYKKLTKGDFHYFKQYIENDMIDILANLCKSEDLFFNGDIFKYYCISIPTMKKLIELFGIDRIIELDIKQIETIGRLNEDQLDYYKSILDINEYFEVSEKELLYPNQIFDEREMSNLSYWDGIRLARSLRLASKSITDLENMPSINIDKTKLRSTYKGIDYSNAIYIDELDPIYKKYLLFMIDNIHELSSGNIPPFEFIFMYVNSCGNDLSKFKKFIEMNLGRSWNTEYTKTKQKFLEEYNLYQMIAIEKNIDWYEFMKKNEEERFNLLCKYQENEFIQNTIIKRLSKYIRR